MHQYAGGNEMTSVTKAMTIVAGLGCAAAYVSPVAALDQDPSLTGSVYMMLPNFTTVRFVQKDAPAFVAALKKYAPNIKVEVVNGRAIRSSSNRRSTRRLPAARRPSCSSRRIHRSPAAVSTQ